jgi:hypothetical protein
MPGPVVFLILLALPLGLGTSRLQAQAAPASKTWRWNSGVTAGALFAPGEIGRDRNATGGHEQLIAGWGGGAAVGGHVGLESRLGGLELRGIQAISAVQVRNEFGVAFPNHGKRPFAWSAGLFLSPLAPIEARRSRLPRPFLTAGLGGHFISVDLDNQKNQTLYHSFHWVLGGGIRIPTAPEDVPSWTPTFLELRVERYRVWRNGPLRRFGVWAATAGLGMRY